MRYVASCVSLFFLIALLVFFYHSMNWSSGRVHYGNVRSWATSFECGFSPYQLSEDYFSGTCFVLLVFFVILDVEVSLLLNMPLQGQLFKNLIYYLLFLTLVLVGFVAEVKKGFIEWTY